jgi:hypothetical protein
MDYDNLKTLTSFELANQRLLEPWSDPALLPKRKTTFDAAIEELTQEYPPVAVGTLQVIDGTSYRYNGAEWIITEKHN